MKAASFVATPGEEVYGFVFKTGFGDGAYAWRTLLNGGEVVGWEIDFIDQQDG